MQKQISELSCMRSNDTNCFWCGNRKRIFRISRMAAGLFLLLFVLSGCTLESRKTENRNQATPMSNMTEQKQSESDVNEQSENTLPAFDSADTAIYVKGDMENQMLTFQNLETGKQYELNYDGLTCFYDKYNEAIAVSQLEPGCIVTTEFFFGDRSLKKLTISGDYWCNRDVGRFEIQKSGKKMNIAKEEYRLDDNLLIISEEGICELMDISEVDELMAFGSGHTIYSIVVTKGHGYLSLANDEYFLGGWIEVGQALIRPITENMVLTVPVGRYQMMISKSGTTDIRTVTVERNREIVADLSDIEVETKFGDVMFVLSPSNATVYLDGEKTDCSAPVRLEYGIHQMIVRADGYDTLTQYLKVGREYAAISVDLSIKEIEDDKDTESKDKEDSDEEKDTKTDQKSTDTKEGEGILHEAPVSNTGTSSTGSTSENVAGSTGQGNTDSNTTGSSGSGEGNPLQGSENSGEGTDNSLGNPIADGDGTGSAAAGSGYSVYVDSPADVEIYVDGNYVGVAPVGFTKSAGSYEVTLRKSGYQTRSYSLRVNEEDENIHYSFSSLTPVE